MVYIIHRLRIFKVQKRYQLAKTTYTRGKNLERLDGYLHEFCNEEDLSFIQINSTLDCITQQ